MNQCRAFQPGSIGGSLINGLRMFVDQRPADSAGAFEVFYSRRSAGPYYRWRSPTPEKWVVTRVHQPEFLAARLCALSWKNVPRALQRRVVNHYEE